MESVPKFSRPSARLCAVALVAGLVGCDNGTALTASSRMDAGSAPQQSAFAGFNDIPVPGGAKMDLDRSLVLGDRDDWIGRLVMSISDPTGRVYDFYFNEMPRFDWSMVTAVRSETSVLTYSKGERVATIQLRGRTVGGTHVSMTVSPRGKPVRPVAPGDGSVQVAPLR